MVFGIVMGVVGAIMALAVTVHTRGFNINTAGWILLWVGVVVLVIGIAIFATAGQRRSTRVENVQETPTGSEHVQDQRDWSTP
jgi:uncharacterized membrane protein